MIKQGLSIAFKYTLSILFGFMLLEIGLRLAPVVIPLDFLVLFNEELRAEIALQLELPTQKWDSVEIERDDGGPELRIYAPFTNRTWQIKETGTSVTAILDDIGFCNVPENSYQQDKFDIVVLGDSFTACHAIAPQDSWATQLSHLTQTPVYNLGQVGVGIFEYIQLLKEFGLQKSPRIVIMNVYEGNDFRDARYYYEHLAGNNSSSTTTSSMLTLSSTTIYQRFGGNILDRYSYAVNLVQAITVYVQENFFDPLDDNKIPVNFKYKLVFPDATIPFNPENVDKDEVRNAKYLTQLQVDSDVFLTIKDGLQTFVTLSKEHGFIPVVTYTPSAYTTYEDQVVFEDSQLTGLMLSFSKEQRQFLELSGAELGYLFIDLTPSLQKAARSHGSKALLYYQHDLHLTPLGHQAVAQAIYQDLQKLKIVEP